jgi:peptidoglycan pentaglycine glycine transferase (the first glycine)
MSSPSSRANRIMLIMHEEASDERRAARDVGKGKPGPYRLENWVDSAFVTSFSGRYALRLMATNRQALWDTFIDQHPFGHLLQSWGWGELKASVGWQPLRLALWDTQQDAIAAAAQVLCRTAPHLPLRLGGFAYIPKGPVINWSQPSLCDAFFSQLNTFLRKRGIITLRMEPRLEMLPASNDCLMESVTSTQFYPTTPIQPVRTIILDLSLDDNALLAQMKEKWRYNVRLAGRKGVTVRTAQTVDDVRIWYALLQTTGQRDQFGIHTLEYYLHAWRIFAPRNQAQLFLAEYAGQLLAGIFVGLTARQAIYLYCASSSEQRSLMPNYLLQWHTIRWAKQQGATSYDFWGIPTTDREDEAMAGVYRFKRGWGGRIVRFVGCYEHVYRPLALRLVRRLLPNF